MLQKILNVATDFFKDLGGYVSGYDLANVKTYSSPSDKIACPNIHVIFENPSIFSNGLYHSEVYPRFRKMRSDLRSQIRSELGLELFKDVALGFVPLLGTSQKKGNSYTKQNMLPFGVKIESIDDVDDIYYRNLKDLCGVRFALREQNGFLIGPEGGMLKVLQTYLDNKTIDTFVDIGAGTGELSSLVVKTNPNSNIFVNEASSSLSDHLSTFLNEYNVTFDFNDCLNTNLPDHFDFMSVGVFYGMQPDFIKKYGAEIKTKLGPKGVLMIQTSMPETLFNHEIIAGKNDLFSNWSWFDPKMNLNNWFENVFTFYLDNEFITLCSNGDLDGLSKQIDDSIPFNEIYKSVRL